MQIGSDVDNLLVSLDLLDSKKIVSSKLSPSLKRCLSVANALIGGPKLVVLDEPAAGIDSVTRRFIWRTLRNHSEGRVIIMTSHYLGEVDVLCRRKVIITKGKVRCSGSTKFLKNLFGIGYHLT